MNRVIIFLCLTILTAGTACKKENSNKAIARASLTVVNAAPDVPSLNVNLSANPIPYYLLQQPIGYGSSFEWGVAPGDSPISIVSSVDTSGTIYQAMIDLKAKAIYSLYVLSGSTKGDVLFMQDSIPYYTDSTAGIRFINLLPDSGPLMVNLQGNDPSQTELSAIAFKQITIFKPYNASVLGGAYTFEIRDAALADPVAVFTWNYTFGKNYTVVISGSEAGGVYAFQVNNF